MNSWQSRKEKFGSNGVEDLEENDKNRNCKSKNTIWDYKCQGTLGSKYMWYCYFGLSIRGYSCKMTKVTESVSSEVRRNTITEDGSRCWGPKRWVQLVQKRKSKNKMAGQNQIFYRKISLGFLKNSTRPRPSVLVKLLFWAVGPCSIL